MTEFNEGDLILYQDPADGHFIPDTFTAIVSSSNETMVWINSGGQLVTAIPRINCKKITDKEQFKLRLKGVFHVNPEI